MRRPAVIGAFLAGLVAVLVGPFAVLAARAAAPAAAGWWWQGNGGVAPAALPAPPGVPDGGLFVAADPGGSRAIGAVRFELPEGGRASTLTLHADSVTGTAAVVACAVGSPWVPVAAGSWADRPSYDCGHPVPGVADGAGTTFTFAVGALARGQVVDVAIVPAAEAGTGDAAGLFQIAFDKPGPDTLSVDGSPPAVSAGDAALPGGVPATFVAGTAGVSALPSGPLVPAEPAPAPATPVVAGEGPAQPPEPAAAANPSRDGPAASTAAAVASAEHGRALGNGAFRAVAAVLLGLGVLGYLVLSGGVAGVAGLVPASVVVLARRAGGGGVAAAAGGDRTAPGGVGRFRRSRPSGIEPPPL